MHGQFLVQHGEVGLDQVTRAEVLLQTADHWPVLTRQGNTFYLAGLLDDEGHRRVTTTVVAATGLETLILPDGVRTRRCGDRIFLFNYGGDIHDLAELGFDGPFGLDGAKLAPAGVSTVPIE